VAKNTITCQRDEKALLCHICFVVVDVDLLQKIHIILAYPGPGLQGVIDSDFFFGEIQNLLNNNVKM